MAMHNQRMSSNKGRESGAEMTHLHIRQASNGGPIVEHHAEPHKVLETHQFGADEGTQLISHIGEALNIKHDMPSMPEAENEAGGAIHDQA